MKPSGASPNASEAAQSPAEPAALVDWRDLQDCDHVMQLYESDDYLCASVSAFLAAGFARGEGGIVIATARHIAGIEEHLRRAQVEVGALRAAGRLHAVEAGQALSTFMVDGMPDAPRFFRAMSELLAEVGSGCDGVRAFGEMVAALWGDGHRDAAVRLEELWNELARRQRFSLLCAYPLRGLGGEANDEPFLHVCQAHRRVIPAESYTAQARPEERLRCVSALQQQASTAAVETAGRREAEQARREEQLKLAVAAAAADVGVWELEAGTHAFTLSEIGRAQFGFEPDEPVSYAAWLGRVHAADRRLLAATLARAVSDRSDFATEFRVQTPEGARWVSVNGRFADDGRPRLVGASVDITARRDAAALLERAVAERTAELEAFAYSMSHDLRTPLRSMRSYAEILLHEAEAGLSAHGRHCLARISASAARLDRMVQEILALSRLSRGQFVPEPVDVDALVRDVVENVRHAAPEARIVIEGVLPHVMGHATALTQCFSNLIDNAVKFVAPGVVPLVRVWSTVSSGADGAEWVRVSVADNGIGIPHAGREAIFQMFQRASKGYDGAGVGLAIVQKAVARLGGRLGVASEPGEGSVFWIELRRAPAARRAA